MSLPPLPEGKGTSATPDLREDPDTQDISVASAASPDATETVDSDDMRLASRRKLARKAESEPTKESKPDDSSSSPPPANASKKTAPTEEPVAPPSMGVHTGVDTFDPSLLLIVSS